MNANRYMFIHDTGASIGDGIHLDACENTVFVRFSCAAVVVCVEYLLFTFCWNRLGLFNFVGLHRRNDNLFNIRAARKQPLEDNFGGIRSDFTSRRYGNTNGNACRTEKTVGKNFNSELRLSIRSATSRDNRCLFAVCSTH